MTSVTETVNLFLDKNSKSRLAVVGITCVAFWLFAAWTVGLAPAFGAGFASSEDVKGIKVQLLSESIITARIQFCTAPKGSRMKTFFSTQVNELTREYQEATGTRCWSTYLELEYESGHVRLHQGISYDQSQFECL